jgi:hypothetical protein
MRTPTSGRLSAVNEGTVFENNKHGINTLITVVLIPFNTTLFKCPILSDCSFSLGRNTFPGKQRPRRRNHHQLEHRLHTYPYSLIFLGPREIHIIEPIGMADILLDGLSEVRWLMTR